MGDRPSDPCVLVIFGAAGDLTQRLLLPSFYNLQQAGLLPEGFAIVGVARADKNDAAFRDELKESLARFVKGATAEGQTWLAERMYYVQGDFDDAKTYENVGAKLKEVEQAHRTGGNALFYLAVPPAMFGPVVRSLGKTGLAREERSWRRVVVEKPFGHDLPSAQALNRELLGVLKEEQIYRIDHYLGKETVQNIMVLRFANGLFAPLWNRDHIDHVQITVAETLGVETRGKFYDTTGALRDMVPNHLAQLLSLIAMEPPNCFDAEDLRTEKTKAMRAVHLSKEEVRANVVRAQYTGGSAGGRAMPGYRESVGVARNSVTETYVAMKLRIENWRWAGVPFYLRTGKALAKRRSEVLIRFKRAPLALFHGVPAADLTPNDLVLHIQPEEGASLKLSAKQPGPSLKLGEVNMTFNYADYFEAEPKTGYETLLHDCMLGDATLFQRADNIESGWRVVQPILDCWAESGKVTLPEYAAGSEGPEAADALLARDGRVWRPLNGKV
ncbi:MAG: glucose-6-phosphate dehydrogenase [Alphaproteobacteria bacterium]|nr:glucose-6-phosphate dehydrogenase [Alphaproteobacteria bacterium]MBL6938477.1 glucose-6-phosphate dehydrogenase [Alphaproteobacteria bacterium]MBL7096536.1 glucose-6-phosphate dehydrogenase [Alphaproteobacteria bacterium]